MLSYRHAFHAGNHADVLKHLVLALTLDHLLEKAEKPLRYLDTHAGPGRVDLAGAMAAKNAEFETGIGRLWVAGDLPEPLARYRGLVRGLNPGGKLIRYPGSPAVARAVLGDKADARLDLCELHPDDHRRLREWAGTDRRVQVHREDGFARLKAALPPPERRAVVLIDPPYEIKDDYRTLVEALRGALKRFATGVYLAWYPMLARPESRGLPKAMAGLTDRWLRTELAVAPVPEGGAGTGMYGSGMFVLNPPWRLREQIEACRPSLEARLCQPGAAGLNLETGPGL